MISRVILNDMSFCIDATEAISNNLNIAVKLMPAVWGFATREEDSYRRPPI